MMVVIALYGVAVLFALAPLAIVLGISPRGKKAATSVVYGACLIVTLTLCSIALLRLFETSQPASAVSLPLGLLSAFFMAPDYARARGAVSGGLSDCGLGESLRRSGARGRQRSVWYIAARS